MWKLKAALEKRAAEVDWLTFRSQNSLNSRGRAV